MTFACITPALIVGAFAERVKFAAVILFVVLWATFVYFPIAHMVWDRHGLFFGWGTLDFAGGTVVHINAGIAALVGAIMIGKRAGYGKDNMAPHSLTLTHDRRLRSCGSAGSASTPARRWPPMAPQRSP